jgi:hypothetical protein
VISARLRIDSMDLQRFHLASCEMAWFVFFLNHVARPLLSDLRWLDAGAMIAAAESLVVPLLDEHSSVRLSTVKGRGRKDRVLCLSPPYGHGELRGLALLDPLRSYFLTFDLAHSSATFACRTAIAAGCLRFD